MGGGETSIFSIMKKFADAGFDVKLLCTEDGTFSNIVREYGIDVYIDNVKRKNLVSTYLFYKKMGSFAARHHNERSTAILFGAFKVISRKSFRNVWTCRGQWYNFLFVYRLSVNNLVDTVICVSNVVREHLFGNVIRNIEIIHLGVDFNAATCTNAEIKESTISELNLDDKCFNILTVARYEKVKGQYKALEAMEQLMENFSKIHYYLVGGCIFGKYTDFKYYESVKTES